MITAAQVAKWNAELNAAEDALDKIEKQIDKLPKDLVDEAWELEIEGTIKVVYSGEQQHLDGTRIMSMKRAVAIMAKLEEDTLDDRIGGPVTTAINQLTYTAETVLSSLRAIKTVTPYILKAIWDDFLRRTIPGNYDPGNFEQLPASPIWEELGIVVGNWILIWSAKDIIAEAKSTLGLTVAAVETARKAAFPQRDSAQGGKRVRHWKRSRRN